MPVPTAIKRGGSTAVSEYEKVQRRLSDRNYDLRKARSPETLAAEGACVAMGLPKIGETPGSAAVGVLTLLVGTRTSGKSGRCLVLAGYGMIAPAAYSFGFRGGITLNDAIANAKAGV